MKSSLTSDPLMEEIRENRLYASNEWESILTEAKKDRMCVAGQVWDALDPKGKQQRVDAKRPFLALDELGQYINQTVNDVRANPRSIKFAPTGNGANDAGADFYQDHTREIEYRSKATVAYSTAFENAVTSGVGWLRISTKREHLRTFNKDLWIEPIVNADQVLPDPNAVWPDSRDLKYLYYLEPWTTAEFTRRFPKAKVTNFTGEWRNVAKQWVNGDSIHVAEYWKVASVTRRLVAIQKPGAQPDGSPWPIQEVLVDELPNGKLPRGVENLREEDVEDTSVKSYLTNGIEVLRENDWKGKYIPFVSCFGKVIYVDGGDGAKRQIMSMTRLARDPFMLYCYYRTCEAELIGMTPKFPYFAYEGQLSPAELVNLQKSLHEPVAVVRVRATVDGAPDGQVLGFPSRQPYEPPIQGLEVGAEAARRAIQAAMGISPLPTEAQRQNDKSGTALRQIESSGQKGSFHFTDHYELMVERTGTILEDLMDKTLDTKREVPIRKADDSADVITINDPSNPDSVSTKGDYRTTVSTEPATESQREEVDSFLDSMVTNIAAIEPIIGPQKSVKLLAMGVRAKRLGARGDAIAEILDPPPPNGPDGKPLPPEVQAMQAQLQQMQQENQQLKMAIETKQAQIQAQNQGKLAVAQLETQATSADKAADREVKLVVAELGAKVDRMALLLEASNRIGVRLDGARDVAHAAAEGTKDRVHEDVQNAKDRLHERMQGAVAHERAQALAAQGVAGQLVVGQQAADNAPQPVDGAGA